MADMPDEIYCFRFQSDESVAVTSEIGATKKEAYGRSTKYIRADLVSDTNAARAAGRCLILTERIEQLEQALLTALPYVEDVLDSPEQLKCFKAGAVQKDVKKIREAIRKAGGE